MFPLLCVLAIHAPRSLTGVACARDVPDLGHSSGGGSATPLVRVDVCGGHCLGLLGFFRFRVWQDAVKGITMQVS